MLQEVRSGAIYFATVQNIHRNMAVGCRLSLAGKRAEIYRRKPVASLADFGGKCCK
ncbi:MAG: hypothetical protein AB9866_10400 [Syntrophobacteraceae bacterium]